MVWRNTSYSFAGCFLSSNFIHKDYFYFTKLGRQVTDPRLIWHKDKLLCTFSASVGKQEVIMGAYLFENDRWIDAKPFQISHTLADREKNWMPFEYQGIIFFIQQVQPHSIYQLMGEIAVKRYETTWQHRWFYDLPLRGNTNAICLGDRYLATFHTVNKKELTYYDNGGYEFEAKPPFRVLTAATKTYLPAEAAVEMNSWRATYLRCCFPTGMVKRNKDLIISYGDMDCSCKLLTTTVEAMQETLKDVNVIRYAEKERRRNPR